MFLLALAAGILPFAVPEVCAAALREGLTLCSGPLLLSLFPFLVVSRLLIQCPESDLLALPFRLAAWGIGIRTPCAARVLCIGFLGGFAPAASAAAQAVRTGQLTAEEADALLPACICSGPSFVVLTVGQSLLGSAELGTVQAERVTIENADHRPPGGGQPGAGNRPAGQYCPDPGGKGRRLQRAGCMRPGQHYGKRRQAGKPLQRQQQSSQRCDSGCRAGGYYPELCLKS